MFVSLAWMPSRLRLDETEIGLISVNAHERSCCVGQHLGYGRVLNLRVSSLLHGSRNRVRERLQGDGVPPLRDAPLPSSGVRSPGASVSPCE